MKVLAPEWIRVSRGFALPVRMKRPGGAVGVDAAAHDVPDGGIELPFVDEHGSIKAIDPLSICLKDRELFGTIQAEDTACATLSADGLTHSVRATDGHGRQSFECCTQGRVRDARKVVHRVNMQHHRRLLNCFAWV